jgi:type II secretory pathway component PulC
MRASLPDQPAPVVYNRIMEWQERVEAPPEQEMAQAAEAITVVSEHERVVHRHQLLDAIQGQVPQLLSLGRVLPHLEGMQLTGLRVAWMANSPLTEKAGFEVGDVITAVNGKPILDPRHMREIAQEVFEAPHVDVTIERAGRETTLRYQMEPAVQPVM